MFIDLKYSGYNRQSEQPAAGYFLILMQPHYDSVKYPTHSATCTQCGLTRENHNKIQYPIHECPEHGILARLKARAQAKQEPSDSNFEPKPDMNCADCKQHQAEIDAQGCVNFTPERFSYPFRAVVRYVRMRQLGHFMMGTVKIGNQWVTLSGSYGSDGLPMNASDEDYDLGTELPQELRDAWNNGGGWNSAGSEQDAMRQWAHKTFPRERKGR